MSYLGASSVRTQLLRTLGFVSLTILAASSAAKRLPFLPDEVADWIKRSVSIGHENTLGAWWSGGLLFLAALFALDGYRHLRNEGRTGVSTAWLLMAIVLCALSLDEIGSLHERAGRLTGLDVWLARLPFGVLIAGTIGWSVANLLRSADERLAGAMVAAAFALFALVALQEKLEFSNGPHAVEIEEGTELIAMLLLLAASSRHTGGVLAARASVSPEPPVLWASRWLPTPVLAVLAIAIPILAWATSLLPDQQRGHPADWLAVALFLLAGFAELEDVLRGKTGRYVGRVGVGGVLVIASAVSTTIHPLRMAEMNGWHVGSRLLLIALLLSAVALLKWLRSEGRAAGAHLWWLVLAVLALVCSVTANTLFSVYLATPAMALLCFFVTTRKRTAERAVVTGRETVH